MLSGHTSEGHACVGESGFGRSHCHLALGVEQQRCHCPSLDSVVIVVVFRISLWQPEVSQARDRARTTRDEVLGGISRGGGLPECFDSLFRSKEHFLKYFGRITYLEFFLDFISSVHRDNKLIFANKNTFMTLHC